MRNPIRFLAGIAMAALLGLTLVAPVAAQEDDAELDDLSQIDGLQRLVARFYSVDFEAMMASMSTPGAGDDGMPDLSSYQYASAGVFEFENDETSEAGYDTLYDQLVASMSGEESGDALAFEETEAENLGDAATAIVASYEESGESFYTHGLFVRDGQYIFYLLSVSDNEDGAQQVQDLARSMVDAEAGDGEETFVEDGTSTGGIWDLLPSADAEALGGMIPQTDEVIFPEEDGAEADS
jgi:hypothetical protein